jgi:RNA polymerase sigma-70 factor (ECF subfamily)
MSEQTTSPTLISRLRQAEDQDAWRLFESIYRPLIRNYCVRRGLQEHDIDDLTQEVFSSVNRAIPKFVYQPERGRFRAWLGTITANQVRKFFRKSQPDRAAASEESELSLEAPRDPDSDWVEVFSERILEVACDRVRAGVDPKTWQTFEYLWSRGMAAADVARELRISIGTVYVNKSRVMKRLEEEILLLCDDLPVSSPPPPFS